MSAWFDGVRLRLDRADEHLATLIPEVQALARDIEDRGIRHEFEPDTGEYIVRIAGEPPPSEWGLRVSELLHHLRSSLDNLVCALVISHGGTIHRHSGFPITTKDVAWTNATTTFARGPTDVLAGVSTDERAIIKGAQPYHAGPWPHDIEEHPLARLRRASNQDKHVLMHPCFIDVASTGVYTDADDMFGDPLTPANATTGRADTIVSGPDWRTGDHTQLFRAHLPSPGPDPQMRVQSNTVLEIALGYVIGPLTLSHILAIRKEVQRLVAALAPTV